MMEGIMKTLSLVNSALVQASPEVNIICLYVMSSHGASLGQNIPEYSAAIHGESKWFSRSRPPPVRLSSPASYAIAPRQICYRPPPVMLYIVPRQLRYRPPPVTCYRRPPVTLSPPPPVSVKQPSRTQYNYHLQHTYEYRTHITAVIPILSFNWKLQNPRPKRVACCCQTLKKYKYREDEIV